MNNDREEFRRSLAIIRFEAECRETVKAGLRTGAILPAIGDREAYAAIVRAGIEAGLLQFPKRQTKGKNGRRTE